MRDMLGEWKIYGDTGNIGTQHDGISRLSVTETFVEF
jgi:hypothetical protein